MEFQERVVEERRELIAKIEKLALFVNGSVYARLPLPEQGRLVEQLGIMNQYWDVLNRRIAAFPTEPGA